MRARAARVDLAALAVPGTPETKPLAAAADMRIDARIDQLVAAFARLAGDASPPLGHHPPYAAGSVLSHREVLRREQTNRLFWGLEFTEGGRVLRVS